jgi:hypothetical protein
MMTVSENGASTAPASSAAIGRRVRWLYLIELLLIIGFAVYSTREYLNFDPNLRMAGLETDWLTSSAQYLGDTFASTGRLPWWQPFLHRGQSALDEAFSFAFNPVSIGPSLFLGGTNGIKVSVVLSFVVVGVGGWFLGWTLNLGFIGRLVLAGMLVLKGNMQSVLGLGYFQLGTAQAYFPWVLAGAIAIARYPEKRWPVILLATAASMLLFAGNIYYTLPMAILVGFTILFLTIRITRSPFSAAIDLHLLSRYGMSAAAAIGIAAVSAFSNIIHFQFIGNHPDLVHWPEIEVIRTLIQFFQPESLQSGVWTENLYTYILPLWTVILLFMVLPPVRALNLPARTGDGRIWAIAVLAFLLFVTWGLSINPIIRWAYDNLPLIGQWRTPERMLTVATFLAALIIALRVDGLHRAILHSAGLRRFMPVQRIRAGAVAVLAIVSAIAVYEVSNRRNVFGVLEPIDFSLNQCVEWVRAQHPNEFVAIDRLDYKQMYPFLRNGLRAAYISADYDIMGFPSTVPMLDLTRTYSPYRVMAWFEEADYWLERGFQPVTDGPPIAPGFDAPCLFVNVNALPEAFAVPGAQLAFLTSEIGRNDVMEVDSFARNAHHFWITVTPDPGDETIVVTQEIAFPGWNALVNGQPANLLSIGQLLGVSVPPGETPVTVEFIYSAPALRIGAIITLFGIALSIAYLLRLDAIPARIRALAAATRRSVAGRKGDARPDDFNRERVYAASALPLESAPAATRTQVYEDGQLSVDGRPVEVTIRQSANIPLIVIATSAVTALFTTLMVILFRQSKRSD